MSYADLERAPEDGRRYELYDGEVVTRAIRHAPDLCVEVLSPSTEATDRGRKLQMFARYGVPEYWPVDPVNETVEVLRLEAGHYVVAQRACRHEEVTSTALPGLRIPLGSLFPSS